MKPFIARAIVLGGLLLLISCADSSPGPLEGTWRAQGMVPMTVTYRRGEEEAMGLIEKVSYEIRGDQVIVTYDSGPMKGTAMRYVMIDRNTAKNEIITLKRVR